MLGYMREASQGILGKALLTLVLAVVVLSFVMWGIADVLRAPTKTTLAHVGSEIVSIQDFQRQWQDYTQRRHDMSPQQMHALGIDYRMLEALIDNAALDAQAKTLGLSWSDDPSTKETLRGYIENALVFDLLPPKPLVAALIKATAERRDLAYFKLPNSAAGVIDPPSDKVLQAFFLERHDQWRRPETRSFDALVISPTTLARPDKVSDAEAQAVYDLALRDKDKETPYNQPEKRRLQQIVFKTAAEAAQARVKIKAGARFEDIAQALKLTAGDIDLGELPKAKIFDTAVAEAAYALPEGEISEPIKGRFGFSLVRVTGIVPRHVTPFDKVKAEIKLDIAKGHTGDLIQTLHDQIEDARGAEEFGRGCQSA